MRYTFVLGALSTFGSLSLADEYVWPSAYDEIEDILSLQSGYNARNFAGGVTPCSQGGNVKGRQNAAEWIRTAFHDMITHDANQGTGGLDGSIWFELDRAENGALAFNNTFNFFNYLYSSRASASDLLAMSVIVAHSACGGTTKIPFRYGRVDAQEAGPAGVPETHTPLDTMLNRFAMAGYNQQDMITLVACGHTLGSVHSHDHPAIVPGDSNPYNDTVIHFDSTSDQFDNQVAVEYLDGTTENPLVVGKNDTNNSDRRIFGSDKNETMSKLSRSNEGFEASCSDVFSRMIDTVPSGVALSQPMKPVDVKPYITSLYLDENNKLVFAGRVRLRTTQVVVSGREDPSNLAVTLHHFVRSGRQSCARINTTYAGESSGLYGETFAWYEFDMALNSTKGLSKFNIYTGSPSSTNESLYDNGGKGYPINDRLLYQKPASCVSRTSVGGMRPMTATIAVRKDDVSSSSLRLDLIRFEKRQGIIVRKMEVETIALEATEQTKGENGDWMIFEAPIQLATSAWSTSFDVIQEGERESKMEFIRTEACARS